jgi:hypothetical protein
MGAFVAGSDIEVSFDPHAMPARSPVTTAAVP